MKPKITIPQRVAILRHLQAGKKISPLQALREFGCLRLAARIYELRCAGHEIDVEWRNQGDSRYAVYRLVPPSDE